MTLNFTVWKLTGEDSPNLQTYYCSDILCQIDAVICMHFIYAPSLIRVVHIRDSSNKQRIHHGQDEDTIFPNFTANKSLVSRRLAFVLNPWDDWCYLKRGASVQLIQWMGQQVFSTTLGEILSWFLLYDPIKWRKNIRKKDKVLYHYLKITFFIMSKSIFHPEISVKIMIFPCGGASAREIPFSHTVAYVVHLKKKKTHPKVKTRNPIPAAPHSFAGIGGSHVHWPSELAAASQPPVIGTDPRTRGTKAGEALGSMRLGAEPAATQAHLYHSRPSPWLIDPPPRVLRSLGSKKMRERGRRSDGICAIGDQANHRLISPQPSSMPPLPEPFGWALVDAAPTVARAHHRSCRPSSPPTRVES